MSVCVRDKEREIERARLYCNQVGWIMSVRIYGGGFDCHPDRYSVCWPFGLTYFDHSRQVNVRVPLAVNIDSISPHLGNLRRHMNGDICNIVVQYIDFNSWTLCRVFDTVRHYGYWDSIGFCRYHTEAIPLVAKCLRLISHAQEESDSEEEEFDQSDQFDQNSDQSSTAAANFKRARYV